MAEQVRPTLAGEHVPEDPAAIEASREELLEALKTLEPYHELTSDPRWKLVEDWASYRERDAVESMLRQASFEEYIERRGMIVAFRMLGALKVNVFNDMKNIREALEEAPEGDEE